MKDPHNPIAFSMTMGEAEELLSRDTEWSSDRLVWVVQFEGDSVSEDPFNRDHPKEYHYAVEVISAIDGTSFDSLRTTSPIFQEGVEYE